MTTRNVHVKGHYRHINGKQRWVKPHVRTIKAGPSRKQQGLFKKARHPKYAKMVSFKDVYEAQESMKKLKHEYLEAKTEEKRLRIARVAQFSANRAKAMLNKKALWPDERQEMRKIYIVYDMLAEQLFRDYRSRYMPKASVSRNSFYNIKPR